MAPFLLVLSGPPGAGKSTVGRLVAERFDPSICLMSDQLYTTIVNGFVLQWEPDSQHQNEVIVRAALSSAARMAEGGYATVLEGVVGPWFAEIIREETATLSVPTIYVVLRPDLATCLERAVTRAPLDPSTPPLRNSGPIRSLWQQFADLGPFEDAAIDTTNQTALDTATAVCERVADA